ncbi:hypothetical protein FORC37_3149 [Vibrio vulnificus]|nr:hypothetical protein FORC37_3149 [Vibrio vulnificus]
MACRWSYTNNSFTNDSFTHTSFTNDSVITLTKVIWARVPKSPKNAFCDLFKTRYSNLSISNRSIQTNGLNG